MPRKSFRRGKRRRRTKRYGRKRRNATAGSISPGSSPLKRGWGEYVGDSLRYAYTGDAHFKGARVYPDGTLKPSPSRYTRGRVGSISPRGGKRSRWSRRR